MRWLKAAVTAGLLIGFSAAATARPVLDCPLRDAPFSAATPLIDLLLSPAATAVVERELGRSFDGLPPQFVGTKAPTFAAIVSLRDGAGLLRVEPDAVARADAALRRLPVTDADRAARCARYDNERPHFELAGGKPRILLFEKMTGFRDGPSVEAAHAAFRELAEKNGWAIASTDKGGAINPAMLSQFDVVVWNNVSGDVLTLTQRRALKQYVEGGGGFLAVHGSAGDPVYFWDWYVDDLIGARFAGHPIAKQFQEARVVLETRTGPLAEGLPPEWRMTDEWYSFKTNPRAAGATVLATLDEESYAPEGMPGQNLRMGDHPIAWSNCVGRGRMFYSAIGHRPETYSAQVYRTMLTNAVRWVADRRNCSRSK